MDVQNSKRNPDLTDILSDTINETFHKIGNTPFYESADKFVIARWSQKYTGKVENYWYGLKARDLVAVRQQKVTHFAYVLGNKGVILLPRNLVMDKVNRKQLTVTLKKNHDLLHYHIRFYVRGGLEWVLKGKLKENVEQYFLKFP